MKPKEPRKRPPDRRDPHIQRLLFYALPLQERIRRIQRERDTQIIDRDDLMYDIALRDGGYRCAKCGTSQNLRLDHIVPVSRGGRTELSNLQLLCHEHNQAKSDQIIDYRPNLERSKYGKTTTE